MRQPQASFFSAVPSKLLDVLYLPVGTAGLTRPSEPTGIRATGRTAPCPAGASIQVPDDRVARVLSPDNADIRYADEFSWFEVGAYALQADIYPNGDRPAGTTVGCIEIARVPSQKPNAPISRRNARFAACDVAYTQFNGTSDNTALNLSVRTATHLSSHERNS